MKAILKKEWVQLLILVVPFCAIVLLWDRIPGWIPIHWNARGEVDGIGRKPWLLLVPALNLFAAILMAALPLIDPKLRKHDPEARASLWRTVKVLRLVITGFMAIVGLGMLAAAMQVLKDAHFTYVIYIGVALLFIVLGNYMSKLKPNYFIGIRTPWTLESKEVWARTHRVGGRLMMLGGLAMLLSCWLMPLEQLVWAIVPISLGLTAFLLVYSYVIYKRNGVTRSVTS